MRPYRISFRSLVVFTVIALFYGCDEPADDDVQVPSEYDLDGWTLTWHDEFEGDTLNTSDWIRADGHWSHNGEMQYYAPDEVYVHEGSLRLRSRYRQYAGLDFTSGHVETTHYQRYGRIDIRAKLPSTKGLWPALWLLPVARTWPPEIDIIELIGHDPYTIHMSNHWGPLEPGTSPWDVGQTATGHYTGPDFSVDFHLFSLEWTADTLKWFIDDELRFSSTQGIPHEPMYLIMNTAIGGGWPGAPDATTIFPQYHDIDYVRFYQREE